MSDSLMLTNASDGRPEPAARPASPLLELRDVTKRYGNLDVLKSVSFSVGEAEIVGLLGDNGAGKSTTVKTISGVVRPTSGELRWRGERVQFQSNADAAGRGIETIYQDMALVDSMPIYRNIFLGRELTGPLGFMQHRKMREIAEHVLKTIVAIEGIDSPDKLVGSLSGGQKQAVAIARAVHFRRTLLVLDEPTSALAVRATEALFEYLRSLREQGVSSVLVTHNLYDAYRICDRFVVMARGQVIANAKRAATSIEELTEKVSRG
ncbi:MAG TPA: ATP-binding cassette domain-containing protein [Conexibacter sp.]